MAPFPRRVHTVAVSCSTFLPDANVKGDAGVSVGNDFKDVPVAIKFIFAADHFELLGSDLRVDLNGLGIEVQAVCPSGVEVLAFDADLALIYHKAGQPPGSVDLRIPAGEYGAAGVDIAELLPTMPFGFAMTTSACFPVTSIKPLSFVIFRPVTSNIVV